MYYVTHGGPLKDVCEKNEEIKTAVSIDLGAKSLFERQSPDQF